MSDNGSEKDTEEDVKETTSLGNDPNVEQQTANENVLLGVIQQMQSQMMEFTQVLTQRQAVSEERYENFARDILTHLSENGNPNEVDLSKSSTRPPSQDVRNLDKLASSLPQMTPAIGIKQGREQYFQTMFRTEEDEYEGLKMSGEDVFDAKVDEEEELSEAMRKSNLTAEALKAEEEKEKHKSEKLKLYRRMTLTGGTKSKVRMLMEEETKYQSVFKRAEENLINHMLDPSISQTETSLAWHLQLQKDLKKKTPSFITTLDGNTLGAKSKPEDFIRWLDIVKKYSERSPEHLRNAKADWRKTVHSSLYSVAYKSNFKYNISGKHEGIEDGRVFFRLRSADSNEDVDLPVGFRMEFDGTLDDLALEPFMILLTLMSTPLDAQDFCLLIIRLMQKQFGDGGPLVKLPSTELKNVREHYELTEDFLTHLNRYYQQVVKMVVTAKEGYSYDLDFKNGISLIYSEKSSQRELLAWFVKNMGSPYLKTWWSKRTEELHLAKSVKTVKKDKRFSNVTPEGILTGGEKLRPACVSFIDETKMMLEDLLEFYNVCEKVVQFSKDNKDKTVHLPSGIKSSVPTSETSKSNLVALESGDEIKDTELLSKFVRLDNGESKVQPVLVSDSDGEGDEYLDRHGDEFQVSGISEDERRGYDQAFSNYLDDYIEHGGTVDQVEKGLCMIDNNSHAAAKKLWECNQSKGGSGGMSKLDTRDHKPFCFHYILGQPCPGKGKCKGYGNWNWGDGWKAARFLLSSRQGNDEKSKLARRIIHTSMDKMEPKMISAGITIPTTRTLPKEVNLDDNLKGRDARMRDPPPIPHKSSFSGGTPQKSSQSKDAKVPRGMNHDRNLAVTKKHQYSPNLNVILQTPDLCKLELESRLAQKNAFKESISTLPDHVYQNMLAAAVCDDRVTQVFNFSVADFGDPTQARLFDPSN